MDVLGHASVSQTSTYLNATRIGLHDSMRRFDSAVNGAKMPENMPTGSPIAVRSRGVTTSEELIDLRFELEIGGPEEERHAEPVHKRNQAKDSPQHDPCAPSPSQGDSR